MARAEYRKSVLKELRAVNDLVTEKVRNFAWV